MEIVHIHLVVDLDLAAWIVLTLPYECSFCDPLQIGQLQERIFFEGTLSYHLCEYELPMGTYA
jgi:hypothetical protein